MEEEKKIIKRRAAARQSAGFGDARPEKKETLAQKQEERIHRLNHLRGRLGTLSPQRWVKAGETLGLAVLFGLNLYLLYPFFGHKDTVNVFSAPVIPVLASASENFISFPYGVRIWLLVFLIFSPLSFYFFVREISGRKLTGFLASLIVSLPVGIFLPLRVNLGFLAEDGAHMASLTFVPLVCLFLLKFLRRGNFWAGIFSALGTTLVALTSPIGFVVLFTFMVILTFSEMLLGRGRLKFLRFVIVLLLTVGFSAFWYNPKFVILIIQSSQGQLVKNTLSNLLPISFFLLPLLGVFGFLLFENRPGLQPIFIAFFLTIAFGLFSLGAGVAHPSPSRFLPAFGISLAFLLGILIVWFFDFLRLSEKRQLLAFGLMGLIFALIVFIIGFFSGNLRELEQFQVLGTISSEQTVGLWEIKEQTGRLENLFGYAISSLAALSVLILKLKLR